MAIHIPPIPEDVMLPAAFLPIKEEECAGSRSFMRVLGIEGDEAQERYSRSFCGPGCYPWCRDEMLSRRAKHVAENRIPVFIRQDGSIRSPGHKIPEKLLARSIYEEVGNDDCR